MGKTSIVKIMEKSSGHPVKVGDRVWCSIDWATARDFGGANCVLQFEKEMGKDAKVWDPEKIAFTFDLRLPLTRRRLPQTRRLSASSAKSRESSAYLTSTTESAST